MSEKYMFSQEKITTESPSSDKTYNILSVDDEQTIHDITCMMLGDMTFDDAKLNIIVVKSALEAKEYIKNNSDIALILLDIIMEHDMAGYDVVNFLRDELDNHTTRVVIRTGQSAHISEEETMAKYDVDGYMDKTGLNVTKLFSIVYTSLRAYRDIKRD